MCVYVFVLQCGQCVFGVVVVLVDCVCEFGLVIQYCILFCWQCGYVCVIVDVVVVVGECYVVGWCDCIVGVVVEYIFFDWWCFGKD